VGQASTQQGPVDRKANVTMRLQRCPGDRKNIPVISFPNNIKFLNILPHKGWNRGAGATELSRGSPELLHPSTISTHASAGTATTAFRKSRKNNELI